MIELKNVVSLFDGTSGGQMALNGSNIKYENYYASENDKYAIQATKAIYPNTTQLGCVIKLRRYLEKPELYERMLESSFVKQENKKLIYHCIDLLLDGVDLLMGGSPCQGFSFAGKQLNFSDPRSKLFFEFVKIKEILKPKYFLLENVKMKKEYQDVISEYMRVDLIEINSALVSAQNRKRLYWTNIEGIEQPEDMGILLKDIIETNSNKIGRMVGRKLNPETGKRDDYNKDIKTIQRIESRFDNKSGALTTVQKDNLVIENEFVDREKSYCIDANYFKKKRRQLVFSHGIEKGRRLFDGKNLSRNYREGSRVYSFEGKAATLTSQSKGGSGGYSGLYGDKVYYRKLTPRECGRLQTVPEEIIDIMLSCGISNSQLYKMLGNGFTISVISHIFSYLK